MLAQACAGKKTSLKAALLDQRVVAGLGNIYVCEALHRARLSPEAHGVDHRDRKRRAERTRRSRLVDAISAVLDDAIEAGGSSLRDHRRPTANSAISSIRLPGLRPRGRDVPRHRGCTGTVRRIVQNGRSTFYCPECQR